MQLDPAAWAQVHDRQDAAGALFRRGLDLCLAECIATAHPGRAPWLDAGCGTGHLAAGLAARGLRVIACDRDPRMIAYAVRRWPGAARFVAADVSATPLADASCQGVVALSLLGYLSDPAPFLAEAARILAPGGTLCLTAMNRGSILLAATRALGWRRRRTHGRFASHEPRALAAALRGAGFAVERQLFYGRHLTLGRLAIPSIPIADRRERPAAPGSRNLWARQFLLVARRLARDAPRAAQALLDSRS